VAAKQGKIAGYNMAGLNKEFQWLISMNSVELCNIPSISAGQTNVSSAENIEILSQLDKEKNVYKKIVIKENKVIGYIFVGSIEKAGIFTMMINDKIDISSFKDSLLNEDFGLINLPKEFRKHLVIGAGIEV
ncbi:MAG TPA: NAD(P)/FAD-dependent oxidoreductase, partial [bacterium]|nr:NAD(P)/FAD-dependent oxidoreductase [bacterium]